MRTKAELLERKSKADSIIAEICIKNGFKPPTDEARRQKLFSAAAESWLLSHMVPDSTGHTSWGVVEIVDALKKIERGDGLQFATERRALLLWSIEDPEPIVLPSLSNLSFDTGATPTVKPQEYRTPNQPTQSSEIFDTGSLDAILQNRRAAPAHRAHTGAHGIVSAAPAAGPAHWAQSAAPVATPAVSAQPLPVHQEEFEEDDEEVHYSRDDQRQEQRPAPRQEQSRGQEEDEEFEYAGFSDSPNTLAEKARGIWSGAKVWLMGPDEEEEEELSNQPARTANREGAPQQHQRF